MPSIAGSLMSETDCKWAITVHSTHFHLSVDRQESYLDMGQSEVGSVKDKEAMAFRISEGEVEQEKNGEECCKKKKEYLANVQR